MEGSLYLPRIMDQDSQKDLISIIIPLYNREDKIKRAISSAIHQTYSNIEIIVVDDCSKDNSIKVIQEFMKQDPRIHLYVNEHNQGPNFTRNYGIKKSSGKYIAFLDSDDEFKHNAIEFLWKKMKQSSPKVGVIYPGVQVNTNGKIKNSYFKFRGNIFKKLLTHGIIGGYSLIRREVFDKVGMFDESVTLRKGGHQDYEMWIRIAQEYDFDYVDKILYCWYFQTDSITFQTLLLKPFTKIRAYLYIWKKYYQFIHLDSDIYVFFCFKIFELLCQARKKELARKVIFMALKTKPQNYRVYYHLLYYLDCFYNPLKILSRFHSLASNLKSKIDILKRK